MMQHKILFKVISLSLAKGILNPITQSKILPLVKATETQLVDTHQNKYIQE